MHLRPELTPGVTLPARLPRGFVLGDHVVDGWLRDGGMAAIYRAHQLSDGRRTAVKLQLPSTAHDPSLGERFEREAVVLWRVRGSAHVVELLDVGLLDDGRRYLVMEWVDGEDLEELLDFLRDQDQRLSVVRACRIARDVARGLAALHEHGVVHLDLKPANVMIGRREGGRDEVVLVDFGIAADLREPGDHGPGEALLGTSGYLSPQRARGEPPTPSCDVYGLGVLLFEALSGGRVPPHGWPLETLPRVDALRHGVPPALAELVHACMSAEPEGRPPSAKVVATVLDAILGALEAGAETTSVEEVPARSGRTVVAPIDPSLALEDTAVAPLVDPEAEDTAVLQVVDEQLEDTAVMEPVRIPEVLEDTAVMKPLPAAACAEADAPAAAPGPSAASPAAPSTATEWLAREERSWLGLVAVAATMTVVSVTAVWVLLPGEGEEATARPSRAYVPHAHQAGPPVIEPKAPSAVDEPAPRPRPEVEPTLAEREPPAPVERRPAVEAPPSPPVAAPPKPVSRPRAAGPDAEECARTRAQADAAKRARAWRAVLQATASRGCWGSAELRVTRARLRVTAYAELGELEPCVREGAKHEDREVAARTALCRKKLGE